MPVTSSTPCGGPHLNERPALDARKHAPFEEIENAANVILVRRLFPRGRRNRQNGEQARKRHAPVGGAVDIHPGIYAPAAALKAGHTRIEFFGELAAGACQRRRGCLPAELRHLRLPG